MPLSTKRTSENPVFGGASRATQSKVFLPEGSIKENIAKLSPGPIYGYQDRIKYTEAPIFSFGNESKPSMV